MKTDYYQTERFDHKKYGSRERRMPLIPKKEDKIKIIIDTDAACEIDDQFGIALAIKMPEKFQIEGFTAVNWGSPDTIEKSMNEINKVIDLADMTGQYNVAAGGPPLPWDDHCVESDAANLIVEKALEASPENPLYVVAIGCATNVATAYMINPDIADNIVLVFHTRSHFWPMSCGKQNNIMMDNRASRALFRSNVPMIMYDTGSFIRIAVEESEKRIKPLGKLGEYLHSLRLRGTMALFTKGMFDII